MNTFRTRSLGRSWPPRVFAGITLAVLLFPALVGDRRVSSKSPGSPSIAQTVAITGATLIDGSGHAPLKDSVVVINGDSIVAAGVRSKVKIPNGAKLIDARGLVIAPGFIDTHNHCDRGLDQ